jgi:hypothetical protein
MKTLFFSLFLCLLSTGVFSQSEKNVFSVCYSFGENVIYRNDDLAGDGSREGKGYFMIEAKYSQIIRNWLSVDVGLNFSRHKLETTPAFMPGIDMTPTKGHVDLMSLPVGVQVGFLRYLFINAGVLLDMELNNNIINHQSGIGVFGGIGAKYDFKCGVRFFVNSFFQQHSLIIFTSDKYPLKIFDSGLKIGVGYRF